MNCLLGREDAPAPPESLTVNYNDNPDLTSDEVLVRSQFNLAHLLEIRNIFSTL